MKMNEGLFWNASHMKMKIKKIHVYIYIGRADIYHHSIHLVVQQIK